MKEWHITYTQGQTERTETFKEKDGWYHKRLGTAFSTDQATHFWNEKAGELVEFNLPHKLVTSRP